MLLKRDSNLKLPKEIREQFAKQGRRGGKKQVPKGFAKMDPARRKEVSSKGGKSKRGKAKNGTKTVENRTGTNS